MKKNLITASGNFAPFVYLTPAGIRVGDCDNDSTFGTVTEAINHVKKSLLTGDKLARCKADSESDQPGADGLEYLWHLDAESQIEAIEKISSNGALEYRDAKLAHLKDAELAYLKALDAFTPAEAAERETAATVAMAEHAYEGAAPEDADWETVAAAQSRHSDALAKFLRVEAEYERAEAAYKRED